MNNTKAQEIRERLGNEVLPEVMGLIETRNEAGEKLSRLEKAVPEHEKKGLVLKVKLDGLFDEIAELLGEDKDPGKKQAEVRKTQSEIAETKAVILSLQEKYIPEARSAFKLAEDALKSGVRQAMVSLRDEYEGRMAKLIDDGIEYWEVWDEVTRSFYGEFRIPLLAGTVDEILKFHRKSLKLDLYIRNVLPNA